MPLRGAGAVGRQQSTAPQAQEQLAVVDPTATIDPTVKGGRAEEVLRTTTTFRVHVPDDLTLDLFRLILKMVPGVSVQATRQLKTLAGWGVQT